MHQLPAFANMTMSVRRELCAVMVFAVVERAGTIVLNNGEEVRKYFCHLQRLYVSLARCSKRTKTPFFFFPPYRPWAAISLTHSGLMMHSLYQSLPSSLFYFLLFAVFQMILVETFLTF